MATRTARRQGTKSKNYRSDPKNIWHKDKKRVGRNPSRLPTDIKRLVKNNPDLALDVRVHTVFDELRRVHNLPIPQPDTNE